MAVVFEKTHARRSVVAAPVRGFDLPLLLLLVI